MKNNKKILPIVLITILLMNIIYSNCSYIFAKSVNLAEGVSNSEYTDEYIKWSNLSDEEKSKTLMPKKYQTDSMIYIPRNMMAKAQMLKATVSTSFNLKNVIQNNLKIRNQQSVSSCWCFAALSSLETNMAMENYKSGKNTSKTYDYSERHMDYTTSNSFLNGEVNTIGYDRSAGTGGIFEIASTYLMNGYGAINESDMPYENNSNNIDISKIQGKEVQTQLYDTVCFNNYNKLEGTEKQNAMDAVKDFVQNYGSVFCQIHGDSKSNSTCTDLTKGAIYCDDASTHLADHAVSIIGWDDNYDKNNFVEGHRPSSNGAWIIRNSWGTLYGDKGFFYVSYEDVNVGAAMYGIKKSKDFKNYDNLYFYDEHLSNYQINIQNNEVYLGTKFVKKTSNTEYLNQVSVYNYPNYELSVYVNTTDSDLTFSKFQKVNLKEGDTETATSEGFQTLEFANPIALTGNSYAVIIKINNKNNNNKTHIKGETKEYSYSSNVNIEEEKCYYTLQSAINSNTWQDLGKNGSANSSIKNLDTTVKAYTTNKIYTEELQNIKVTKEPSKTTYYEGENFDKTGMEVIAYYDSLEKKKAPITSYTINNGNSLKKGQTSVTISYEGKTTTQPIEVLENKIKSIEITTPPSKTKYYESENFDSAGMVITAIFDNGTKKVINDYTIQNGENLKIGQNSVTINYDNLSISQSINVIESPIETLEITTKPNKTIYYEGENFDSTGMVITAIYKNRKRSTINDYTIQNGENLKIGQNSVTINYDNLSVTQSINVIESPIESIQITTAPSKTKYYEGENFNSSGMVITATYKNGKRSTINDYTIQNGENLKIGQNSVTINYDSFSVTQSINVVESPIETLEITTPPSKIQYIEGENFDSTGMVITAIRKNGKRSTINDYTIQNGENLKIGQNSVTVNYDNLSVTQSINVIESPIESIQITTAPSKTKYYEGENFNSSGMVITAIRKNGKRNTINDYTIQNGENLKIGQNSVTINYDSFSVTQSINVVESPIETLEITTPPTKTQYIEGENFDSTGMVITAIYKNGKVSTINGYKIINGNKLQKNQEAVTISFTGKTIDQMINVKEKEVSSIEIVKLPNKTQYKQNNEELDLTGGKIKVKYNNNTEDEIELINSEIEASGFDNKQVGIQTILIKYKGKETKFNVEVVELEKPKNSNFTNANSTINSLKYYTYSDNTKKAHFIISVNIDGINFENNNDNNEYYFYISTNENEKNISNWLTPTTIQKNNNGFNILLDTNGIDFSNYDIESNSLKLFIKEVSTKNEQTATDITNAINLSEANNSDIEIYYDNSIVKKETSSPNSNTKEDKTVANGRIPQTGTKNLIIIFVAILCAGAICLIRYEVINKNMK